MLLLKRVLKWSIDKKKLELEHGVHGILYHFYQTVVLGRLLSLEVELKYGHFFGIYSK